MEGVEGATGFIAWDNFAPVAYNIVTERKRLRDDEEKVYQAFRVRLSF